MAFIQRTCMASAMRSLLALLLAQQQWLQGRFAGYETAALITCKLHSRMNAAVQSQTASYVRTGHYPLKNDGNYLLLQFLLLLLLFLLLLPLFSLPFPQLPLSPPLHLHLLLLPILWLLLFPGTYLKCAFSQFLVINFAAAQPQLECYNASLLGAAPVVITLHEQER